MPYSDVLLGAFARLNEWQMRAVLAGGGMYVLAGTPGSGKSTTLATRIARLIADGYPPEAILAMTFTKAAAASLQAKVASLAGQTTARISTIHSLCYAILGAETELLKRMTLDDRGRLRWERRRVLLDWQRTHRGARACISDGDLDSFIADAKACGLTPTYQNMLGANTHATPALRESCAKWAEITRIGARVLYDLYWAMEEARGSRGLYDFDDMLNWAWTLLLTDSVTRAKWARRWGTIINDETQDNCPVQYDISRLLAGLPTCIKSARTEGLATEPLSAEPSIMFAADPAQSIYSFRAAHPELLVDFAAQGDVQLLTLPMNYRSVPEICRRASKLVSGKSWHLTGDIVPTRGEPANAPGLAIRIKTFQDYALQLQYVFDQIQSLTAEPQKRLNDCAILARLNASLQLAEVECVKRRIPYVKRSSGTFFSSQEVQDILSYIRVACWCDPDGRWSKHVINHPFRYIDAYTINTAEQRARQTGASILAVLEADMAALSFQKRRDIEELLTVLRRLNQMAIRYENGQSQDGDQAQGQTSPDAAWGPEPEHVVGPAAMIDYMLEATRYIALTKEREGAYVLDDSKLAMIYELRRMAVAFKKPVAFLQYIDAMAIAVNQARRAGLKVTDEEQAGGARDALTLSTVHSAKGLEYRHVFVIDVNEGTFPFFNALSADEELRLFYVAVTRAMDTCTVTSVLDARNKDIPSRFITMLRETAKEYTQEVASEQPRAESGPGPGASCAVREHLPDRADAGRDDEPVLADDPRLARRGEDGFPIGVRPPGGHTDMESHREPGSEDVRGEP